MRVLGYRAFGVEYQGQALLASMGHDHAWTQGLNVSSCDRGERHRPGATLCTCGFWAFDSPAMAVQTFGGNATCYAAVLGSGQVTLHEHGWRAQRAQIVCLYDLHPDPIPEPETPDLMGAAVDFREEQGRLQFLGSANPQVAAWLLQRHAYEQQVARQAQLRSLACAYGVPLIPVRGDLDRAAAWAREFGIPASEVPWEIPSFTRPIGKRPRWALW